MSGLSRTPGKRVGVNSPPRVRIPLPPPGRRKHMHAYVPERFSFAFVNESSLALLHEWLCHPHVAQWWQPTPSIDELRADHVGTAHGANETKAHVASYEVEPIGFIQSYVVMGSGGGWWEEETDPGARGIDQFLCDADKLGKGLGSTMIQAFVSRLFADPAVTTIQTDPSPNNERTIRCYVRAGFAVERTVHTPDGPAVLTRRSRLGGRRCR
jgi:RimJ/RimL family protein N-acetyltransferase